MPTLDHDSDTARRDHGVNRLRYVPSQPFLDLKSARVSVDQAGQLAQAYDPAVWHVADVRAPKEGKQIWCSHKLKNEMSFTITISS